MPNKNVIEQYQDDTVEKTEGQEAVELSDNTMNTTKEATYEIEESIDNMAEHSYNSFAYSFSELEQYSDNAELWENFDKLTMAFNDLARNIVQYYPSVFAPNETPVPKEEMVSNLITEYTDRVKQLFATRDKVDMTVKDFIHGVYKKAQSPVEKLKSFFTKNQKQNDNFMLWKEADGSYRWLAIYSNNFRDRDVPSNIISAKSHKRFVELVEKGEIPYPDLQHWHTKGTEWGKADWLAYDDETGFALASGYVLEGHEQEAEALAELSTKENIGVSHGMPMESIKLEDNENGVIIEHITVEISDLPNWAAANQLTSFAILNHKEDNSMTIPEVKKQYLRNVGVSDTLLQDLDKSLKDVSDSAKSAGIEYKEASDQPVAEDVEPEADEVVAEEVTETVSETAEVEVKETLAESTEEVLAKAVIDVMKPFVDELNALKQAISDLQKPAEVVEQKAEKQIDMTPAASLSARILKSLSPVLSQDTISGAEELARTAPVETREEPIGQPVMVRGNPVLGKVLSNMLDKKS